MATDLRQTHFRFGKDDGTESSHTFWQLADVNHTQLISADWTFLLRFTEQEAGGTAAANTDAQFQYNKNGAGWVDITTTSSVVKAVAVGAFTNGQNCTQRLSGTGTFETSGAGCTEDGSSGGPANDIAASGNSETEAGLAVIFADVANGDTIQFRFRSPDWTVTYTITPTLTLQIAVPQSVSPNAVPSTSAIQSPALSGTGTVLITLSPVAQPSAVQAPSLTGTGSAPISPSPVAITSAIPLQEFSTITTQYVTLTSVGMSSVLQTPSVAGSGSAPVSPSAVAKASTIQSPSVAGTGNAPISLSPVQESGVIQAPAVTGSGNVSISPTPVSSQSSVAAPTLAITGQYIQPTAVSVSSGVQSPSVSGSGSASIAPSAVPATSAIASPTIVGSGLAPIEVSPVSRVSQIQSPSLSGSGSAAITLTSLAVTSGIAAIEVASPLIISLTAVGAVSAIVSPIVKQLLVAQSAYDVLEGRIDGLDAEIAVLKKKGFTL